MTREPHAVRRTNTGSSRTELALYLLPLAALGYPLLRWFGTTGDARMASLVFWLAVTVAVVAMTREQALLAWVPIGVLVHLAMSFLGLPLSLRFGNRWAAAIVAAALGALSISLGDRYSAWFLSRGQSREAGAKTPLYFSQSFNAVTALFALALLFLVTLAVSGLLLVASFAAIVFLPIAPQILPWVAPAMGLLTVLATQRARGRHAGSLMKAGLGFILAAVLARVFRTSFVGALANDEWPLVWYSVFAPLIVTAVAILPKTLGQRVTAAESGR